MIKLTVTGTKKLHQQLTAQRRTVSAQQIAPLLKLGTDEIQKRVEPWLPVRSGRLRRAFISWMAGNKAGWKPAAFYIGVAKKTVAGLGTSVTPYLHLATWGSRPRYAGTKEFYRRPHASYVKPPWNRKGLRVLALRIPIGSFLLGAAFPSGGPRSNFLFRKSTKGAKGNPQIVPVMRVYGRAAASLMRKELKAQVLKAIQP